MQVDEEPPIRANTTILLGNLAPHLSEATCKRVMLNAFTRALKDSFPPARSAGLKVLFFYSAIACFMQSHLKSHLNPHWDALFGAPFPISLPLFLRISLFFYPASPLAGLLHMS